MVIFTEHVQFLQDIVAINMSIENKSFYTKPELVAVFDKVKSKNGRLHFLGLVSDGGVHSHITHLEALLTAAKQAGVTNSYVHFFSDGRDTSPVSGGGRGMACSARLDARFFYTVQLYCKVFTWALVHDLAAGYYLCKDGRSSFVTGFVM